MKQPTRFTGPVDTDTRRYRKGRQITWFTGDTIREASHKLYDWVFYMGQRGYSISTTSVSWGGNNILLTYTLIDTVKPGKINFGGK